MLLPMIPLTVDIAILDEHTRLTCFETNALSCHAAAVGTAVHRASLSRSMKNTQIYSLCQVKSKRTAFYLKHEPLRICRQVVAVRV